MDPASTPSASRTSLAAVVTSNFSLTYFIVSNAEAEATAWRVTWPVVDAEGLSVLTAVERRQFSGDRVAKASARMKADER